MTQVLRSLATLPLEERRKVGARANEVKSALESRLIEKKRIVEEVHLISALEQKRLDVTLPGRPVSTGRSHPITQTLG